MATNRELLQQELQRAQSISQSAISGQGFDPRGGVGVLLAQLGTAGIGAFAQNRARKKLLEEEEASTAAFERRFPSFKGANLSAATREAIELRRAEAQISQQFAKPKDPSFAIKETDQGLIRINEATGEASPITLDGGQLGKPKKPIDLEKRRETTFKETRDLRKEFTKNSGEFILSRDAFDRVQASAEDPSAAGDLALIFNFMKVLDPGSTVREGEFATAANSASIPETIRAKYNKVIAGERLSDKTRDDFVTRSVKLFDKALGSQRRRIKQFTGIAQRNNLPVEDVILDLIGNNPDNAEVVAIVAGTQQPTATQPAAQDREGALAELRKRGLVQ